MLFSVIPPDLPLKRNKKRKRKEKREKKKEKRKKRKEGTTELFP